MTAINDTTRYAVEERVAVVTLDNPPVNALSHALRKGIRSAVERAVSDPLVEAIVLICAGRTFIAGADIKEFGKPLQAPSLRDLEDQLEASPKPVVAAIHGTALGGGFELALACHYRIAAASAKVGLPEIKLGLIPGAGGTQRLPRLIGVRRALDLVLSGSQVDAETALGLGMVDEIAAEDLRRTAIGFARTIVSQGSALRRIRDIEGGSGEDVDAAVAEARQAHGRRLKGYESFEAALEAVKASAELPFDEGLRVERKLFERLLAGTQSKAQRYVFAAERAAAKLPEIPADMPTLPIARVGIVGAGTMGGGIAMNFLNAGLPVIIVETRAEALDRGLATIRRNYESTVRKGRLSVAEMEKRMALLTGSLGMGELAGCDLVIEAVFETMEVKRQVFGELDRIVKQGAILASNTSYLDVNKIAAATSRPEWVLGLHFFSPANVMRLLEVVRGEKTRKDVLATAMKLGRDIGKVAVPVGVCHGFVGNRMLAQRQREAANLVLEGAMPWDVDRVLTEFGLPMGPFQMSDLAGLDLGWSRETSKGETLRERLCELDRRGQKTGAGYYDYDDKRRASPSPVTEGIIRDMVAERGTERRAISDTEILERCIFPMINEGAKILDEGIAQRASDIDTVWINGYGWPAYRGGPMFHADAIGLQTVLEGLQRYEASLGAAFHPSPYLERLVAERGSFTGAV